jgi:2-hydroxychromene-2-carboxylate isomerase
MKKRTPKLYFSFQSPYSWIGTYIFENNYNIEIEYIPYWKPGKKINNLLKQNNGKFIKASNNSTKHLYLLEDVKRLAKKMNFKVKWPVDSKNCWDLPHLSYLKARNLGKGKEFVREVFHARWQKGENVCNIDIISKIADRLNLDENEITNSINDPQTIEEGVNSLYKSFRDDVFGVPFFIYGYNKFWGIERIDDFVSTIKGDIVKSNYRSSDNNSIGYEASNKSNILDIPIEVLDNINCYDCDHPGGCG